MCSYHAARTRYKTDEAAFLDCSCGKRAKGWTQKVHLSSEAHVPSLWHPTPRALLSDHLAYKADKQHDPLQTTWDQNPPPFLIQPTLGDRLIFLKVPWPQNTHAKKQSTALISRIRPEIPRFIIKTFYFPILWILNLSNHIFISYLWAKNGVPPLRNTWHKILL